MLRDRSIRALLVAQLVSLTGTQMTYLALPWFVLVSTGSAARMGAVLAAELLPVGLFGIPSGSVLARVGARRTMLACDLARAPLVALIPLLHWTGLLSFPLLLAVVFCVGVFNAPYQSARTALLPDLIGEDEALVARGTSLFEAGRMATTIAGPVLGGVLIAVVGAASVLVLDAVSYLAAFALVLLFVRARGRAAASDDARGVLAGVRFLLHDSLLGPVAVVAVGLNLAASAIFSSLPVLVYFRYDADPHIAGYFFAAFGIGSLAGSVASYAVLAKLPLLKVAAASMLLSSLPLWLLVPHLPAWGVAVALAFFGFFLPFVNAPMLGVITVRTPAALRPKVLTALFTIATLAAPIGLATAGPALQRFGPHALYLVLAAMFGAMAVLYAAVVLRHAEETPEALAALQ